MKVEYIKWVLVAVVVAVFVLVVGHRLQPRDVQPAVD